MLQDPAFKLNNGDPARNASEPFRTVPTTSESFGTVPHPAESFGAIPNASASVQLNEVLSERKTSHTLTTRIVARMFEAAGVARTERTIVKWCQPHTSGPAHLDAFFDISERRYLITEESVTRAIKEEQDKAVQGHAPASDFSSESRPKGIQDAPDKSELLQENRDLKRTNQLKELYISQLRDERNQFYQDALERSRIIGTLENQIHQLSLPASKPEPIRLHVRSDLEKTSKVEDADLLSDHKD